MQNYRATLLKNQVLWSDEPRFEYMYGESQESDTTQCV